MIYGADCAVPLAKGGSVFPKGLGNLGNLGGMMKSALEMKSKIEQMKAALADERVEATSGGGMVSVVITGNLEVVSVTIVPEVIDKDDPEMLGTLIQAAMNEGIRKAQEMVKEKMTEITHGLDIPGITS
jgi:hypothetical protein